jgi:hypothetical protein
MNQKTYEVTLQTPTGETRKVAVPSPTGVQAGDAARPLMVEGEAIISITELPEGDTRDLDGGLPKTQAEELAPVTPGAAAVDKDSVGRSDIHG